MLLIGITGGTLIGGFLTAILFDSLYPKFATKPGSMNGAGDLLTYYAYII